MQLTFKLRESYAELFYHGILELEIAAEVLLHCGIQLSRRMAKHRSRPDEHHTALATVPFLRVA